MPKILGKVQWACVHKPNTKFNPVWSVDLVLTPETEKELMTELKKQYVKGMKPLPKIKVLDDGTKVFKFRRNVYNADGGENTPPIVRDIHNRDTDSLIGNGSVCKILYSTQVWDNTFGKGVRVIFKGIQILELVPYGEDFEDESGGREEGEDDEEDFSEDDDSHESDPF